MTPEEIKKLISDSEKLINRGKYERRRNREKCVGCKTEEALEGYIRCEKCKALHEQELAEKRAGKILQRENKPNLLYDANGKLVYEHRVIMEKILGRPLTKDEVVTWRNGVKNDNRPENLILALRAGVPLDDLVCPHCEEPYRPRPRIEVKDEEGNSYKQVFGKLDFTGGPESSEPLNSIGF